MAGLARARDGGTTPKPWLPFRLAISAYFKPPAAQECEPRGGTVDICRLIRPSSCRGPGSRPCYILSFDLRPRPGAAALPPFTAGAHVDVHLPDLQTRSYSLLNDQSERNRYVIAVRCGKSRFGSRPPSPSPAALERDSVPSGCSPAHRVIGGLHRFSA